MIPLNSCNGAALPRFGAVGFFLLFLFTLLAASAQSGGSWTGNDVGTVGLAGSDAEAGGVVTVRGAGADIWGRADAFHFRWQALNGDGAIIARVTATGGGNVWAKAGLMVRADLTANAANVMALITPGNRTGLQSRATAGADTVFADAGSTTVPQWLKLERAGNTFRAFKSANGTTWTPIGTATVTMNSSVYIGLAVSSHNTGAVQTATFDNVSRSGSTPTPPPDTPPPPTPPAENSTAGWASADLGGDAGTTSVSGGTVALVSSGGDIWSNRDAFRFYYRELQGDGTLTARVTGITRSDAWAKAGVMIRATLDPYSANAAMVLSAGASSLFQARATTPGSTVAANGPWVGAPYWVRISRVGNVFTGSVSANGTGWTVVSSQTLTMPASVQIGLAASSHGTAQTTATFENITVVAAAPGSLPPSAPDQPSMSVQSSSSILVAWRDNSTTEAGFVVERSTDGTTFTAVTTTAADATRFTDTGLRANTTYYYRICARNAAGDSAYTTPLYVTTFN